MIVDVVIVVEDGIATIQHVRRQLTVVVLDLDSQSDYVSFTVSKCTKYCAETDPEYGRFREETLHQAPAEKARAWIEKGMDWWTFGDKELNLG